MSRKKILIDLYKIKDLYTGLGQFSANFAYEIAKHQDKDFHFSFLVPAGAASLPENIPIIRAHSLRRYFPMLNSGFDVWHSLHQFPSHFPSPSTRQILTVHDLNFLTEKNPAKAAVYLRRLQRNVQGAHTVTAISEYTRKHLLEHIPVAQKVEVVHNGVALPPVDPQKPPGIDGKFFFSLSVFKKAKNFEVLIPLMKHFPDYRLVIAGNHQTDYGTQIRHMIREAGLERQVLLPGVISNAEKLWLYQNCAAFLFPSLAEGFGLPVIEAMMCGKPVVLSRYTCLPEIGGNVAYYFDDFTAEKMANTLQKALEAYEVKGEILSEQTIDYAKRYSWKECIRGYLLLYAGICKS